MKTIPQVKKAKMITTAKQLSAEQIKAELAAPALLARELEG